MGASTPLEVEPAAAAADVYPYVSMDVDEDVGEQSADVVTDFDVAAAQAVAAESMQERLRLAYTFAHMWFVIL